MVAQCSHSASVAGVNPRDSHVPDDAALVVQPPDPPQSVTGHIGGGGAGKGEGGGEGEGGGGEGEGGGGEGDRRVEWEGHVPPCCAPGNPLGM